MSSGLPFFSPVRIKSFQICRRAKPAVHHLPHFFSFQLAKNLRRKIDIVIRRADTRPQEGNHLLGFGAKFIFHSADGCRHDSCLRPLSAAVHQRDRSSLATMNPNRTTIGHPNHKGEIFLPGDERIHRGNHPSYLTGQNHRNAGSVGLFRRNKIDRQALLFEDFRQICRRKWRNRTKGKTMEQPPLLQFGKSQKVHCPG